MSYPPLIKYQKPEDYRQHYKRVYCEDGPIRTFDGIDVYFYEDQFDHIFFESSNYRGNKDTFSIKRAERIDWIQAILQDQNAELYLGYDSKTKGPTKDRRVAIINQDNYVVIIRTSGNRAKIISAYVADSPNTAKQIRNMPKWTK